MPLFSTINYTLKTTILVWKISENLETLFSDVVLNPKSLERVSNMKSEQHKLGFLCIRKLLEIAGYSDFDLTYDDSGKPHLCYNEQLQKQEQISISHSHQFATIIISDQKVGIDIEKQRDKILKIADKFSVEDVDKNVKQNYIQKLTVIWGVKEAIFKIQNQVGISFKDHIFVADFEMKQQKTTALLNFENQSIVFEAHFVVLEDFILVFVFEKN